MMLLLDVWIPIFRALSFSVIAAFMHNFMSFHHVIYERTWGELWDFAFVDIVEHSIESLTLPTTLFSKPTPQFLDFEYQGIQDACRLQQMGKHEFYDHESTAFTTPSISEG